MKFFYTSLIALLFSSGVSAAAYTTHSFSFGGVTRQYLLYVPSAYNGSQAYPFVMALHGLGDNMNNFKNINMNLVADTAHFILAFPQALVDSVLTFSTAWNSGAGEFGITLNPNVDDVGFLNALIDTISANYNVDQTRIYSTGFSMGGFMSNRLACELNNRIAAIASVSGTIGNGITCAPSRDIAVAHFHGTADQTVNYTGNPFGDDPEAMVAYWVHHNHCDSVPASIDTFPNISNDGKVVVHYKYPNGNYDTKVEFFKVIGGAHEWLGPTGNDINYAVEIWRFLYQFHWEDQVSGIRNVGSSEDALVNVYPNPAWRVVNVQLPASNTESVAIKLLDATGKLVYAHIHQALNGNITVQLPPLSAGIYMMQINSNGNYFSKKIILSE